MLDLLLNLSIADLLVGLVTVPIDLVLESGVVNYSYEGTCQLTLAISNGKSTLLYVMQESQNRKLSFSSPKPNTNFNLLVPPLASLITLCLIAYEESDFD